MNKTKRTETIEEFDDHGRLIRKTTTVEEIEEEPQKLTTTWTPTVTDPYIYHNGPYCGSQDIKLTTSDSTSTRTIPCRYETDATGSIKGVYSNEENN